MAIIPIPAAQTGSECRILQQTVFPSQRHCRLLQGAHGGICGRSNIFGGTQRTQTV